MAHTTLLLLSALALAATCAEGTSYGRGYGYLGGPRRRVLTKVVPLKRIPYSRKSTVFRSPHDSYDQADALRTADHDVRRRIVHAKAVHAPVIKPVFKTVIKPVVKPVHKTVFTPPYPPAVVQKTVHVPLHTSHDDHAAHVTHVEPVAHVVHEHAPYRYSTHVVPECAHTNDLAYNVTYCLDDVFYPTDTIIHELKKNHALTDKLMSDVTYQSADNLVDGLTKAEEEQYTPEHYYGAAEVAGHPDGVYAHTYAEEGGYICPSDIVYGRLKRALNTFGEWKVIVNLPDHFRHDPKYKKYVQTSRLESCVHPGASCSFVEHLFPSACLQKHAFVRLVAYTYEKGLHVDSFKLPSACSCHVAPKLVVQ